MSNAHSKSTDRANFYVRDCNLIKDNNVIEGLL